ncbi:MFS transporter [Thiopseudomonas alkaliphila]|uniref:MFS transporter n=1 Tax=Thiopseudomonas alkaliphila TaxID=1697053 RepID=UPI00069D95D7|nr:MFS transporter [Thiopseudomonas alkaliphila]AKX44960.1 MFS transporter [Thiopseudomonas alkaliphila]AKX47525.1 MFS transporter [Thiopseudomonas alkaliphila]AKX53398.1 MFS transporter [Thiopseudomonas alkaliphila]
MRNNNDDKMNQQEWRAAGSLSLVYAFRMLGMFMVLPVLATYGTDLTSATPVLIGVAIGAYGLTQAFLQVPFGIASDRFGRFPVIYFGLVLFALGSILAAVSDSIYGVIAGRVLQGAGAISAAVMALLSDLTREQHRTKVMGVIGVSIGFSFAVAMVIGPIITRWMGLAGLFWFTALMAVLGIVLIRFLVPRPKRQLVSRESGVTLSQFKQVVTNPELLRMNLGIFVLHAVLMASFIALPLSLQSVGALPKEQHWWVYLIAMSVGFFGMIPFIIYSEKQRKMKRTLQGAILFLLLAELYFLTVAHNLALLIGGIIVFFTAFNLLEASMPSLISKIAPASNKGTAMGVYSTTQFLGAALGGILGGWLFSVGEGTAVFAGCAVLLAIWWISAWFMQEPPYVTSTRMAIQPDAVTQTEWLARITAQEGVSEAVIVAEEAAVYIKFDAKVINRTQLESLVPVAFSE